MSEQTPEEPGFSEIVPQYVRVIDPSEGIHVAVAENGMVLVILGRPPLHETMVVHPLIGEQVGPAITLASAQGKVILETLGEEGT